MKNNKSLIVGALVMALLVVSIGYAAIATISLVVSGTATATTSESNFKVKFTSASVDGDSGSTATVTNDTTATITVQGIDAKDEEVVAKYVVKNVSPDLTASLAASVTNSNTEYFKVEPTLDAATIAADGTATLTVKVTCLKTPIQDDITSNVTVTLAATPVQPEE